MAFPIGYPTGPIGVGGPSSPDQPSKDHHGGFWSGVGHQLGGLKDGVVDGVVDPLKLAGGLVGIGGDASDNWGNLLDGLEHDLHHPLDFGKALIGWDDLAAGEYGHWAGEIVPGIAAALLTGGAGAAVRGTKAAEDIAKVAGVADDWPQLSGVLRDATKGKGNFGIGSATAEQAAAAGRAWVGDGAALASDGKTWISADGLRQWRPPSYKPNLDRRQSNFERRQVPQGAWQGNGHLDITPDPSHP